MISGNLPALPCFPSFPPVGGLMHLMPELRQRGVEQQPGDGIVIGDQGIHS